MHEVAIMSAALEMALDAAKQAGAGRITRIQLRVGNRSGTVPEALRFAWDVVRGDTAAGAATLEIESVAAVAWCGNCQTEFCCGDYDDICPCCQRWSGELRRGRELELAAVELE